MSDNDDPKYKRHSVYETDEAWDELAEKLDRNVDDEHPNGWSISEFFREMSKLARETLV